MSTPIAPKLRLFLAVRPELAALESLDLALGPVRTVLPGDQLRWSDPEKLHITLRFFGSVAADAPAAIAGVCRWACADRPAFALSLSGAGAFPSPRRASVLWIGISEGSDELRALAAALNPPLDRLSFAREEREFTPHLTVARAKQPLQLTAAIAALSSVSIRTRVDQLLLMRSILGGPSARYETVESYPLTQPRN